MGGTCINKNRIGRTGVNLAAIAYYHLHVRQVCEIIASTGSQLHINLHRGDMSVPPDDFSYDCRIVAGATTNVDYIIGRLYLQPVDQRSQKTGMPVVKVAGCVNRDEDIVIESPRVCILGCKIPFNARASNLPGSRTKEMFARNLRKCFDERFRLKISDCA